MALIRPKPYPVGTKLEVRVPRGVPVTVTAPSGAHYEFAADDAPHLPRKSARAFITLTEPGLWTWSWPAGDDVEVRTATAVQYAQPVEPEPEPVPAPRSEPRLRSQHG